MAAMLGFTTAFILLLTLYAMSLPRTVSHILAWQYESTAEGFVMAQCTKVRSVCVMQDIAALDGAVRQLEVTGLNRKKRYCWQVRLADRGQMSNVVCT